MSNQVQNLNDKKFDICPPAGGLGFDWKPACRQAGWKLGF